MTLTSMRVGIFFDVENCPLVASSAASSIVALRDYASKLGSIVLFNAYADLHHQTNAVRIALLHCGVLIRDVPQPRKNGADMMLLTDMMGFILDIKMAPATIILVSTDAGFAPAIHKLTHHLYPVHIISHLNQCPQVLRCATPNVVDWRTLCNPLVPSVSLDSTSMTFQDALKKNISGKQVTEAKPLRTVEPQKVVCASDADSRFAPLVKIINIFGGIERTVKIQKASGIFRNKYPELAVVEPNFYSYVKAAVSLSVVQKQTKGSDTFICLVSKSKLDRTRYIKFLAHAVQKNLVPMTTGELNQCVYQFFRPGSDDNLKDVYAQLCRLGISTETQIWCKSSAEKFVHAQGDVASASASDFLTNKQLMPFIMSPHTARFTIAHLRFLKSRFGDKWPTNRVIWNKIFDEFKKTQPTSFTIQRSSFLGNLDKKLSIVERNKDGSLSWNLRLIRLLIGPALDISCTQLDCQNYLGFLLFAIETEFNPSTKDAVCKSVQIFLKCFDRDNQRFKFIMNQLDKDEITAQPDEVWRPERVVEVLFTEVMSLTDVKDETDAHTFDLNEVEPDGERKNIAAGPPEDPTRILTTPLHIARFIIRHLRFLQSRFGEKWPENRTDWNTVFDEFKEAQPVSSIIKRSSFLGSLEKKVKVVVRNIDGSLSWNHEVIHLLIGPVTNDPFTKFGCQNYLSFLSYTIENEFDPWTQNDICSTVQNFLKCCDQNDEQFKLVMTRLREDGINLQEEVWCSERAVETLFTEAFCVLDAKEDTVLIAHGYKPSDGNCTGNTSAVNTEMDEVVPDPESKNDHESKNMASEPPEFPFAMPLHLAALTIKHLRFLQLRFGDKWPDKRFDWDAAFDKFKETLYLSDTIRRSNFLGNLDKKAKIVVRNMNGSLNWNHELIQLLIGPVHEKYCTQTGCQDYLGFLSYTIETEFDPWTRKEIFRSVQRFLKCSDKNDERFKAVMIRLHEDGITSELKEVWRPERAVKVMFIEAFSLMGVKDDSTLMTNVPDGDSGYSEEPSKSDETPPPCQQPLESENRQVHNGSFNYLYLSNVRPPVSTIHTSGFYKMMPPLHSSSFECLPPCSFLTESSASAISVAPLVMDKSTSLNVSFFDEEELS